MANAKCSTEVLTINCVCLNSIEFLWSYLKKKVRDQATSTTKIGALVELANSVLKEIPNNVIENFNAHIEKKENWFWEIEGLREETIRPIIIPLDEEISDEDSDETNDDDDDSIDSENSIELGY